MTENDTITARPQADGQRPLLQAEHVQLYFPIKSGGLIGRTIGAVHAVDDVSLNLAEGQTLGIVGESGCGKSTLARCLVRLLEPTDGALRFHGADITKVGRRRLQSFRREVQFVFQDPVSSLNPRRRITDIVAEPLTIWKIGSKQERRDTANAMLDSVGIDPTVSGERRPREFSGGQCQRISIARALMSEPELLICDEPVSALDVSVQAQILNLLEDLKRAHNLTILFIAHDLAVVKNVSDRVAVMYLGRLCEIAPSDVLYQAPAHHYTAALLSAAVEPDPAATRSQVVLAGEPPSPINPPSGCRFRTRCPRAEQRCAEEVPELRPIAPGHQVACHFPLVG